MRPVLVLSNIDWGFVWQRHQTIAALFAQDHDVVFCEIPGLRRIHWRDAPRIAARLFRVMRGTRRERQVTPERIRIVRPFVLPATNAAFCALNGFLIRRFVRRQAVMRAGFDVVIDYSPTRTARQLLGRVPYRQLVYDCTDNWPAVHRAPRRMAADERWLLENSDLTLVPSRRLLELKTPDARRIERLPHGAYVERFLVPPKTPTASGVLTVLYYGHLYAQHLDFRVIDDLARVRPEWRIILVGPIKTPHQFAPNVELPGQQPHEDLRGWIQRCDALILPYVLNDYTRAVLPAKTYECLASGRPIVATPLPELLTEFAGIISFATGAEWPGTIEQAVREDTAAAREGRVALARANTWSERYRRICAWLAELEPRPRAGAD